MKDKFVLGLGGYIHRGNCLLVLDQSLHIYRGAFVLVLVQGICT